MSFETHKTLISLQNSNLEIYFRGFSPSSESSGNQNLNIQVGYKGIVKQIQKNWVV